MGDSRDEMRDEMGSEGALAAMPGGEEGGTLWTQQDSTDKGALWATRCEDGGRLWTQQDSIAKCALGATTCEDGCKLWTQHDSITKGALGDSATVCVDASAPWAVVCVATHSTPLPQSFVVRVVHAPYVVVLLESEQTLAHLAVGDTLCEQHVEYAIGPFGADSPM